MSSFLDLHTGIPGYRSQRTGQTLSVAPGIIVSNQPNAFAARYGDTHVIGITTGLEDEMFRIAKEAFSKPYVFRDGDKRHALLGTYLDNFLAVVDGPPTDGPLTSFDEQRPEALVYVLVVMYRFALLHELAHCLKGHVDYMVERNSGPILGLDELNISRRASSDQGALTNGERHVLEFDADYHAMISCMRIEGLEYDEIFSHVFDPETRFVLSMFAIYAMTWLFASLAVEADETRKSTHPHAVHRLSILYTGSAAIIGHEKPELTTSNHYALSQLKAIEYRLRTGWMQHSEDQRFDPKDYQSVAEKLTPYAYQLADSGGKNNI